MFTGDSDLQSMLGGMSQQQLMQLLGTFGQFSREMMNWECAVSYLVNTDVVVGSDKRINSIAAFLMCMWLAVSKYAGICTSTCMRVHRDILVHTNVYTHVQNHENRNVYTYVQNHENRNVYTYAQNHENRPLHIHTHTHTLTHSLTPSVTQAHMLTRSLTFTLTQSPGLVNFQ